VSGLGKLADDFSGPDTERWRTRRDSNSQHSDPKSEEKLNCKAL
jgi:hypothetical protein